MEFKLAVGTRRTIRYFQAWRPVEKDKVQKVLEAARLQSQHGNASHIRNAVVVTNRETSDDLREGLIAALYNQPQAVQPPVAIIWTIDMAGWDHLRSQILELIDCYAVTSSYGWSEEFVDDVVLPTPDFNVMSGDRAFAEWLSAFEAGLAVGSALLAAVDEGLGTALVTGQREQIAKLFGMPDTVTPTQIQLLGYPAESVEAGDQRPRPPFEDLYFEGTWGVPLRRDPKVVAELEQAGLLQPPAPLPWRASEVRALAATFGLPE